MEPLITIETIPIEIKFVEKKQLKLSCVNTEQPHVAQEDVRKHVKPKPIRISVQDSFEPSTNYNWDHSTYTATAKVGEDGKLKLNVQMEDGEARAIRFKQTNRNIDSIAGLIPTTPQDGNNDVSDLEISFDMSGFSGSGSTGNNTEAQFYPPDLELVVTQRPEVIIKYVGGPIYVPLSSDPHYKPLIGFEDMPKMTEGLRLDQKV